MRLGKGIKLTIDEDNPGKKERLAKVLGDLPIWVQGDSEEELHVYDPTGFGIQVTPLRGSVSYGGLESLGRIKMGFLGLGGRRYKVSYLRYSDKNPSETDCVFVSDKKGFYCIYLRTSKEKTSRPEKSS